MAGTAAVAYFEFVNRDKELNLELARLSLTILAGEYDPNGEQNPLPARRFAIRALSAGTGVSIPEDDLEVWAQTGATPIDPNADILNPGTRSLSSLPLPIGALDEEQITEQFGVDDWAFTYLDPSFEGGEFYLDDDPIPRSLGGAAANAQPTILSSEDSTHRISVIVDGQEINGEFVVRIGHVTIVGIDRTGITVRGPFPLLP